MPTNCSPSEGRRAQRWETIHIGKRFKINVKNGFLNIRLNMPQKLRYVIAWVIRTIKINEFGRPWFYSRQLTLEQRRQKIAIPASSYVC